MTNRAIGKHGNVGGPTADVDHGNPKLGFVAIQNGITRGHLFEHNFFNIKSAAGDALDYVLGRTDCAGNDMYLGFKANTTHANGLTNTVLPINNEVLGKNVQDLLIVRNGLCLRRIKNPLNIFSADFISILDSSDTAGVHAGDMGPGNTCVNRTDPAFCGEFRLLDGLLDRLHGGVDICYHALTQTSRGMLAYPQDLDFLVLFYLGDNGQHL